MKFHQYVFGISLTVILPVLAQGGEPIKQEMPRRILGLYKGSEGRNEENNEIYLYAQLPLNYLGYHVQYQDAEKGLPDDTEMRRYKGIITWFQSPEMIGASRYRQWLLHQMQFGKKVIIFENLGAFQEKGRPQGQKDLWEVARVFETLGLRFLYNYTNDSSKIRIAYINPEMMAFERAPTTFPIYEHVVSIDPRNRVYLSLLRTDLDHSTSDVVVVTPKGGFAFTGCILWEHENKDRYYTQWYLDPFRFFSEALESKAELKPDIATLNGRRIFFSHIDGDGLSSASLIDNYYLCGEIIEEQILKVYPLPFTVSVITSMIDPEVLGNVRRMEVARSLLSLPNVEAASHGFAHPFDWRQGILQIKVPGYSMDIEKEVTGSIEFINKHLLPAGKRVQLFLWTGECNPDEATLEYVRRKGIRAMNGGEGMVDAKMPSISVISPATAQTGNQIRINARASNDFEFTHKWSASHYDGFKNVIATFKTGDRIYRTTPIDVYFHFYSGERAESLKALKEVFAWVLQQKITPIYASQYHDIIMDFLQTKIWKQGKNRWWVHNNGYLRTLRLDTKGLFPDFSQSKNIIGYKQDGDHLYIYLNGNQKHSIVLTTSPPEEPYLAEANAYIDGWKADSSRIDFRARGYGRLYVRIANLQKSRLYQMKNLTSGTIAYFKSDPEGYLTLQSSLMGWVYPSGERFRIQKSNRRSYYLYHSKLAILLVVLFAFIVWYITDARKKFKHYGQ